VLYRAFLPTVTIKIKKNNLQHTAGGKVEQSVMRKAKKIP